VQALKALASAAGGDAPAPESPHAPILLKLEGLTGNDLLNDLFVEADGISQRIKEWKATAAKIAERAPAFDVALKLVAYGRAIDGMEAKAGELEAIRQNRSLLDDPDPVTPIGKAIGVALREAILKASKDYADVLEFEQTQLCAHPAWTALPEEKREALLSTAGVVTRPVPPMGTDTALLSALQSCDLADWRTNTDALQTQCTKALSAAIKEAEPKARRITLPTATICTQDEADTWLKEVRTRIEKAIKDGPVIL
jgi:hypothetical protein